MKHYIRTITIICTIPVYLCASTTDREAYRKEQQETITRCQTRIAELHPLLKQATKDMRKYELAGYQFLRNLLHDTKKVAEFYEIAIKFNGKERAEKMTEGFFAEVQKFFETEIKPTFSFSSPEEAGISEEEFKKSITPFSLEKIKSTKDFKKLLWKYAATRAAGEFMLFLNSFNQMQKYVIEMVYTYQILRDAEQELEVLK